VREGRATQEETPAAASVADGAGPSAVSGGLIDARRGFVIGRDEQ
jgi:hypothetical protein